MKRPQKRRPGHSERQRAWNRSEACRAAALRGSKQAAALREAVSKCGARRKSDGEPCQMIGLQNGRCRLHGGLTPRGADWHRVQYPKAGAPAGKAEKKIRELERRRKRQAARVAAMSPESRAKYAAQSQAAQPRSLAERENKRRAREVVELFSRPAPAVVDPQIALLQAQMNELNVEEVRLRALLAAHGDSAESIQTEYEGTADE